LIFLRKYDRSASVHRFIPTWSDFGGRRKNQAKISARFCFSLILLCLVASAVLARAARAQAQPAPSGSGAAPATSSSEPTPVWANRGRWNFGFQVGYAVENAIPRNISHINLLIAQPQLGFIVRDFRRGPVRRFEILDEGILGNAVHPGGHLLGTSLLFRFDGKPYGRVMPFLDMGAGVLHTTLSTRTPELTGRLQFLPQAGLGIQYFFRAQRALVFEFRYLHMSNAGIEPPNEGFNASMLTIGFRWLRRPQ
jgi:hypothetical protein